MNPLLTRPPDEVVTERVRTHWIDTNVLLEVYSHGDLYFDWALSQCSEPPLLNAKAAPEYRRLRMQEALWLAMALVKTQAVTLAYEHESLKNILRLAPPDSEVGGWTSTILYVLGDGGVFDGWDRIATKSGNALSNRDRDRLIVRACSGTPITAAIAGITPERERNLESALSEIKEHTVGPLILVTHDETLICEARAVGVDADKPSVIAVRTMTREQGRVMFDAQLEIAVTRYLARGPLTEWLRRMRAMDRVHQLYAAIWSPEDRPWFPQPSA